jgi:L-ascorbate metabolism protein UlaG (beta-lactamase superfamily)
MFEYGGLFLIYLGHSGFFLRGEKAICIDPFEVKGHVEKADVIICTHEDFDHCSPLDIKRFAKDSTKIVASSGCQGRFSSIKVKETSYILPGETLEVDKMRITAIPAYNLNKFRSPGRVHHPKADLGIGVVIEIGDTRVYHAGDTDLIPEMSKLHEIDIALLPVSGTYVMTPKEAAEAVRLIKPKVAIPMHYGAIIGGVDDARNFRDLLSPPFKVVMMKKDF